MKKNLAVLSALILLGACNNPNTPPQTKHPENTGINTRDSSGDTLTSGDQSETATDRTISQNVRRAIESDSSLSLLSKNIKIVTVNGVVTLRGPVSTEQEKKAVAEKARGVKDVIRVDNQLEVSRNVISYHRNHN